MTSEDIHRKLQPIVKVLNNTFTTIALFCSLLAVVCLVGWLAILFPYPFIVGPILGIVGIYVAYYVTKPKIQSELS